MKLHTLPNGETVAFVTLYGTNRDPRVLEWHKKVMVEHWGLPINYVECPFHAGLSHGAAMNQIMANVIPPTYWWWWDNDCIALKREVVDHVLDTVRNKRTVWGQAWKSAHKAKPRGGDHPYASQACLCFPHELYVALGRPDCDHHLDRSDTAEEITFAGEARGYTVALQWPSHSDTHTTELGQLSTYGRGNIYGPGLTYHESRADLPDHVDRFVAMAQRVLAGEFGG